MAVDEFPAGLGKWTGEGGRQPDREACSMRLLV